jgi:hypothetical protein
VTTGRSPVARREGAAKVTVTVCGEVDASSEYAIDAIGMILARCWTASRSRA